LADLHESEPSKEPDILRSGRDQRQRRSTAADDLRFDGGDKRRADSPTALAGSNGDLEEVIATVRFEHSGDAEGGVVVTDGGQGETRAAEASGRALTRGDRTDRPVALW